MPVIQNVAVSIRRNVRTIIVRVISFLVMNQVYRVQNFVWAFPAPTLILHTLIICAPEHMHGILMIMSRRTAVL